VNLSKHPRPLLTALALAALVAACGGGSVESHLASARGFLEKGEHRSAIIEAKSALQKQAESPEARFVLGKALLESGDAAAAAIELRKARQLKHPDAAVLPALARAMLEQGQARELIAEFGAASLDDKPAQASLKTSLGMAHFRGGRAAEAQAALEAALAAVPDHVPARVEQARMLAAKGELAQATQAVDALVTAGRANVDAWILKGDLAQTQRQWPAAAEAYRKALALEPAQLAAHGGAIRASVAAGDLKAAATQVEAMKKARPSHPSTTFMAAMVALEQRELKTARELAQSLLKAAPDHPMVNQLAGAIELAAGALPQALVHLGKSMQGAPNDPVTRVLMAQVSVRSGEPAKAIDALAPLLALPQPGSRILMLAGEAHMQLGEVDKAADVFKRASAADPGNAQSLTALARTKLAKGEFDTAVADLDKIAESDAGTGADSALIAAHMQRKDFAGALKAIDRLERKLPDKAVPQHLRGIAKLAQKDVAGARTAFEGAMSKEAGYFPAAAQLAGLDANEGKLAAAQQRMEAVLKAQPGHPRATLALADLRTRTGVAVTEVVSLFGESIRLHPNEAGPRVALVNLHLLNKQNDAALSTAQQAEAALPGNPAVGDALGRAQLAIGQNEQALATFGRLANQHPTLASPHLRIADVHLAMKNPEAAQQSLRRALAASPDSTGAQERLFGLGLRTGQVNESLALAREAQKKQPGHSMGWVMEGDVLRARKDNEGALKAYKTGLAKAQPALAAVMTHATLAAMGRAAEAERFAASWMKDHPKDTALPILLADQALARQDLTAAEAAYRRVIEIAPNHAVALNNLAWLLIKNQKPGGLAMAEKAVQLQPHSAAMIDTLASALAAEKRYDEALVRQIKAVELDPTSHGARLRLAQLYVQTGKKIEAREQLAQLEKLGDKFAEQGEVKKLLSGL
jgi:cellulose synthase operon protein C